ncbi:MAG: aquaporin [Clostridia bacterium]|nr:aquaporin [Clostridia bacterium]
MKTKNFKAYIAEFIGTCVLVVFGCGTATLIGCDVQGGYLATAFAFGLVIVAMAYSIGNISGCHINPAVSLGLLINKKIGIYDFICYVIAQVLGAIAGAGILRIFFDAETGLGTNGIANVPGEGAKQIILALVIECILTFVFVLAILGVTSKAKNGQIAGLVIGLTLVLVHILGIGLTGTSVNPARSIGPALFVGGEALKNVWIFIVGPLVGSAIAGFTWKAIGNKD